MVFDPSTARPIEQPTTGGFDISTARPEAAAQQQITEQSILQDLLGAGVPQETATREASRLAQERGLARTTGQVIAGLPEAAGAIATGIAAEPVAGLAGLVAAPFVGAERAAETVRGTREALTFEPVTEAGKTSLAAVGGALEPVAKGFQIAEEALGGGTLEATGSPALAAAAATIPTAVLEALGLASVRKASKAARIDVPEKIVESPELQSIFNDLPDEAKTVLAQQPTDVIQDTLEQLQRKETFQELDVTPTQAQVARDPTLFQQQQELAKTTGPVRTAVEAQEAVLSKAFDDVIRDTQGNPVNSGAPQIDAVVDRATTLDQTIGNLYREARERAPDANNIALDRAALSLRKNARSDALSKGAVKALAGEMNRILNLGQKSRKAILSGGIIVRRIKESKISVSAAEQVRKFANSIFTSTNDLGRTIIRQFKDALDEDVFSVAGEDLFNNSRAAKARFETQLSNAKISKFDKNERSLVRDMLENKIDPDQFFQKVILGKTYRASDLKQLRSYLLRGTEPQVRQGLQAFKDLRAEAFNFIKETAFTGPADAQGFQAISRTSLNRALDKLGESKQKILFTDQERAFLRNLSDIAVLKEPPRATALGRGPSAQAIQTLARRIPGLSFIVEQVNLNKATNKVLKLQDNLERLVKQQDAADAKALEKAAKVLAIPAIRGEQE